MPTALEVVISEIWDGSVIGLTNWPYNFPPFCDVHELRRIEPFTPKSAISKMLMWWKLLPYCINAIFSRFKASSLVIFWQYDFFSLGE